MLSVVWPLLPAFLKARACRRIVVTGAESTGTTTLALALAEALDCPYVPEYGRDYTQQRSKVSDTPWREEELVHIAQEQIRLENEAATLSPNGWLIADTDALTTTLWHERYFGEPTTELLQASAKQADPFCYIITGDEIPFEADEIREGGRARHEMHRKLREKIASRGQPFLEVTGPLDDRVKKALAFLKSLGARPKTN